MLSLSILIGFLALPNPLNTVLGVYGANLSPLFLVKSGPSSRGGCDGRLDVLQKSYSEGIAMIDRANTKITDLQRGSAATTDKTLWAYGVILLYNLFRVKLGADGQESAADPLHLKNDDGLPLVKGVYQGILQYANMPNPPDAVRKLVVCVSEDAPQFPFVFIDANAPHPDGTLKTLNQNGEFKNGAYYLAGDGTTFPSILVPAVTDVDTGSGTTGAVIPAVKIICTDMVATSVIGIAQAVVIFCEEIAFNEGPRSATRLFRPTLVQTADVVQGDLLTWYASLSETWVHELTHLWSPFALRGTTIRDMAAVDPEKLIAPYAQGQRLPWVVSPKDPRGRSAIGVEATMQLANNYPAEALENADNYAIYALALWLDQWLWQWGVAGTV